MIEQFLLAALLLVAAGGAAWDVARRIIPNLLCLALAAIAAAYAFSHGGVDLLGSSAIHAGLALAGGMGLFALGVLGGGDAKFYAASALSLPLAKALPMLVLTALSGLVLLVVMVLARRFFARAGYSFAELRKVELPYGVAIASGLGLTLLMY